MDHNLLDPVNIKILNLLQHNGRLQIKEISEKVYKSETPVGLRIRRLQEEGVILGYVAVLDRRKVGMPTMVITHVRLSRHTPQSLSEFGALMNAAPEVQVCLQLAGEYDFLLQLTLHDALEYEVFLSNTLGAIPYVERYQSFFVLKDYKVQTALPLTPAQNVL
jgi:Lrp/AsnC family leucine-responsive transcriptional regulator